MMDAMNGRRVVWERVRLRRCRAAWVLAAAMLACALSAFAVGAWQVENAWAEDVVSSLEGDANYVNPQQISDSSFIYDMSIADVASADSYLNNETVQVKGEAVGDIVNAGVGSSYCWVTLTALDANDSSTVAIYMSKTAALGIGELGRYGVHGDTVQVSGTFHLTCTEHQGISDIHADAVTVVAKGYEMPSDFSWASFIPGLIVVGVGVLLWLVFKIVSRARRKQ